MLVDIKVPPLAESVTNATLLEWAKNEGDFVHRDEQLVELETDKVMLEINAPQDGVLKEIVKKSGELVVAGDVIAVLDGAAQAAASTPAKEIHEEGDKVPAAQSQDQAAKVVDISTGPKIDVKEKAKASAKLSPAVRKLMEEHELQPAEIRGSGRDGRIVKADVLRAVEERSKTGKPAPTVQAVEPSTLTGGPGERIEQRVPMSRLRARIAERLLAAQHGTASLTTFNEVNMQPVMDIRARYQERFQKEYQVKLGFMSFFIKASLEALKKFPIVNASIDGDDIVYHGYFDIGVAVSTPRGLVVPVIRDVDKKSFAELEASVSDHAAKARDNKITIEELTGGTFTITNGGIFGSLLSTPILNPPQSAILGMHKIQSRPMVENGEIVIRPMMNLALSYDHRIIDGRDAVMFLVAIKEELEDPARILLEI